MKQNVVYYNYFEDVNPRYESPDFSLKNRLDPDAASARLYDALYKILFNNYTEVVKHGMRIVQIRGQKFKGPLYYSFFVLKEINPEEIDYILSSDYIGPSINQAKLISGYEDSEIKKFLRISRTLGGHILWPRGDEMNPTINKVKGGEISPQCGYGFYDRIDWTLLLLKIYYTFIEKSENPCFDQYEEKIRMSFEGIKMTENDNKCFRALFEAFSRANKWFRNFRTFRGFCDFFILNGNFVDDQYEVLELTPFFPIKPVNYEEYIENNIRAISRRNQHILYRKVK